MEGNGKNQFILLQLTLLVLCPFVCTAQVANAIFENSSPVTKSKFEPPLLKNRAERSQEPKEPKEPEEEEEGYFPEIEFVASNKFRSLGYIQPVLKQGFNFETHYFGIEGDDVAVVNGSWTMRAGKHVKLSPGLGVYFGEGQRTSPAVTFRWEIEKGHLFSQGLFLQSLGRNRSVEEEGEIVKGVHPSIWDGNHVSYRLNRWEVGPLWERIHGREGNEWKGGVRSAFRFWKHVSGLLVVVGPDTEVRVGFIIHSARE